MLTGGHSYGKLSLLWWLLIGSSPSLVDFKQLLPHQRCVSPTENFFALGVPLILTVLHVVLLHVLINRNFVQSVAITRGQHIPVERILVFLGGVIVASILSVVLAALLNLVEARKSGPSLCPCTRRLRPHPLAERLSAPAYLGVVRGREFSFARHESLLH